MFKLFTNHAFDKLSSCRGFRRQSSRPARLRNQLCIENLEDRSLLTSFLVNSTLDSVDMNPGDGVAEDINGQTTLRAAIMEANALNGDDVIQLGAGTFPLNIVGNNENAAATGDLDVSDTTGRLKITGAGAGTTIVEGPSGWDDRIFQVLPGAALDVSDLSITGGTASGGGISGFSSSVTITNAAITGNQGAAIDITQGALSMTGSEVSGNTNSTFGGGIVTRGVSSAPSFVVIVDSVIADNERGGLRGTSYSFWTIDNSTISRNTRGSAISFGSMVTASITDSTISDNIGAYPGILSAGNLTIDNSSILGNEGTQAGGLYITSPGVAVVTGTTIADNSTTSRGAGVGNNGELTIVSSLITRNHAIQFAHGAGVHNFRGKLTIIDTIISDNIGDLDSAAIYNRDTTTGQSEVTILDSLIVGNRSPQSAIHLLDGTNRIERTTIANNFSGGIQIGGLETHLTIVDSTVYSDGQTKAGIWATSGSTLEMKNTTVSGKGRAGTAYTGIQVIQNAVANIDHSTITGDASNSPLSVGIHNLSTGPVTLKNSIVAANSASGNDLSGGFISAGNNLIGSVGSVTGFIDGVNGDQVGGNGQPVIDPLLGPLQNNGGPTFTHALLPSSPAIDAADCTAPGGSPVVADQRGFARPQGATCDIGAFEVEVTNEPPTADVGGPYTVNEGGSISLDASRSSDPDQDASTLTFEWDLDDDGDYDDAIGITATFNGLDGLTVHTIKVRVTDDEGEMDFSSTTITVNNVAPHDVTIDASVAELVFAAGSPETFSGSFQDVGLLDTHDNSGTYWSFSHVDETGNLVTEIRPATVNQGSGSGTISDDFSFAEAGVYQAWLTITDDDGDATTSWSSIFVVYDPSAGFVTGGGWINSPAGADRLNPEATGKAALGFVSKYKKGATAPTGQTEFRFNAGGLDFHSESYDWLVVAGAKAQYKGAGTINGTGNYGFMLTAIDGQATGGGGMDRFRIKIWDKDDGDAIRYDNQTVAESDDSATPSTELGGGQIMIHSGGKKQMLSATSRELETNSTLIGKIDLRTAVAEGIEHWIQEGITTDQLEQLLAMQVETADLPGHMLGLTSDSTNRIWIDIDAGGHGWNPSNSDYYGVDLLSTVTHELGHVIGLDHDDMEATLGIGHRDLPSLGVANAHNRNLRGADTRWIRSLAGSQAVAPRAIDGFFAELADDQNKTEQQRPIRNLNSTPPQFDASDLSVSKRNRGRSPSEFDHLMFNTVENTRNEDLPGLDSK